MNTLKPDFNRNASRLLGYIVPTAIAALTLAVFWPGLFADWGRDDYMQLAMTRMVDSPWPFFTTDHFVFPNAVFRPMGFASFWLGQSLFGSDYTGHAVLTLGLFLATLASFYSLLRILGVERMTAALVTALLACHPVAIGTTLWWSARFDLLATLFAFLAMRLAASPGSKTGWPALAGTPLLLLAALLSKEIALAAVPAIVLIFQHRAWTRTDRRAHLATLMTVLAVVIFMLWRLAVLGTLGSGITGDQSLFRVLIEGISRWPGLAAGYFSFDARLPTMARLGLVLAAAGLLIALAVTLIRSRQAQPDTRQDRFDTWMVILLGLILLLSPVLLQAPVARLNAAALSADATAVEAAMQSRLYFLSLAGLSLMLAGTVQFIHRVGTKRLALIASGSVFIMLLVFAPASYHHAADFARQSRDNARLAHAAMDAVLNLDLPVQTCHLIFTGVEPPLDWSIYVSMDSIIKALHPRLTEIDHCFFHADYPTYYHFLDRDHARIDSDPFQPRSVDGTPLPRRTIGQLTLVHLDDPGTLSEAQRASLRTIELSPEVP